MADQEFLASFGVQIDESSVARLQQVLEGNRELAGELAGAFDSATEAIRSFQEELGALPGFSGITEESFSGFGSLSLGLDTEQAKKQLDSFIALAKKPIPLSANASGIVSAGRSAYESLRSLFSSPLTISVRTVHETDDSGESSWAGWEGSASTVRHQMSTGGRFTKPTDVQVAEDGDAEYIIPVKKEDRAVPLVRQMLGELSPEARESVTREVETDEAVPELKQQMAAGDRPLPQVQEFVPELNQQVTAGIQPVPQVREIVPELNQQVTAGSPPVPEIREAVPGIYQQISAVNQPVPEVLETVPEETQNASAGLIGETAADYAARPLPSVRDVIRTPAAMQPLGSEAGETGQDSGVAASVSKEQGSGIDASGILAKLSDILSASLHETGSIVTQNTNQNVSAPVNIQVHASGVNAEQIGESVYNTAERYLLRTLKGAFS